MHKKMLFIFLAAAILMIGGCGRVGQATPTMTSAATVVGKLELEEFASAAAVGEVANERYLFLATYQGTDRPTEARIRVFNLKDPASPAEVGSLKVPVELVVPISALVPVGNLLYAVLGGEDGGLWVIDISLPVTPRQLSLLSTESLASGLAVKGNLAYVTYFPTGISIIDVSDPQHPHVVESFPMRGGRPRIADSLLYLVDGRRLHIIDLSTPTSPREVGSYAVATKSGTMGPGLPGAPMDRFFDVAASHGYAFLASGVSGLRILDTSDPTSPRQVAQLKTPGAANSVVIQGKYLYLGAHSAAKGEQHWSAMRVVDVSDPRNPRLVDSLKTDGYKGFIMLADNYAYFIDLQTLWVIDISDFTDNK